MAFRISGVSKPAFEEKLYTPVTKGALLTADFYHLYHFNDMYVFNIYIVFILGDLSCMES